MLGELTGHDRQWGINSLAGYLKLIVQIGECDLKSITSPWIHE